MDIFGAEGFLWDKGNKDKNWLGHKVSWFECEQVFFNIPLLLSADLPHSHLEERLYALGRTNKNRQLFLCFTLRNNLIRIISARDMSRKERQLYEKEIEKSS